MAAPGAPVASFEEHFARETLASERMRASILATTVAALLVFFGVLTWLFHDVYRQYYTGYRALFWMGGILGGLLAYELTIRQVMGRWLRRGRTLPQGLRYLNALVETSVPSLLILAAGTQTNPAHVLQSAAA